MTVTFPLRLLAATVLLLLSPGAAGADPVARQREDLQRFAVDFEMFQAEAERRIPPEILREARGLLILREQRAGLLIGARRAVGVALLRHGKEWGPPVFYKGAEGNLGLQAGWQEATFFQVLMTEAAIDAIRSRKFRLGVDLRVTSGPRTLGDDLHSGMPLSDVLVYADTSGVFGGVAFGGGWLAPDERSNRQWYERESREILEMRAAGPGAESRHLSEVVATAAAAQ